jgi:methanogenic corrinoid protein MtbC1
MSELIDRIAYCIEFGKIEKATAFPPSMKDQDGAFELTKMALDEGLSPEEIIENGLIAGMDKVGTKFSNGEVFVPQMLMSAKAMSSAMEHIRPFFENGAVKRKGVFVIGSVLGDLHDIGKNLVAMMVEGGGWEVVDLGTDVSLDKFMAAIDEHPDCVVGLSALLTTTMGNMDMIVSGIREKYPDKIVLIGGAPVSDEFRARVGADFSTPDPQKAVQYMDANALE